MHTVDSKSRSTSIYFVKKYINSHGLNILARSPDMTSNEYLGEVAVV